MVKRYSMPIIKILLRRIWTWRGLNEARKLMRLREGANGDSLNITPRICPVPAALEFAAHRAILSSSSLFPVDGVGTINQNPGIINVVKDMAEVIVEPRLDKANNKGVVCGSGEGYGHDRGRLS